MSNKIKSNVGQFKNAMKRTSTKESALDLLKRGLSMSEVARKLGISRQMVSVWNREAGDIAIKRGRMKSGPVRKGVIVTPIADRVSRPDPETIRNCRISVGLTQEQAALMIKETGHYQVWCGYEAPTKSQRHHKISLAEWELFLLLTNNHPTFKLERKGNGRDEAQSQLE